MKREKVCHYITMDTESGASFRKCVRHWESYHGDVHSFVTAVIVVSKPQKCSKPVVNYGTEKSWNLILIVLDSSQCFFVSIILSTRERVTREHRAIILSKGIDKNTLLPYIEGRKKYGKTRCTTKKCGFMGWGGKKVSSSRVSLCSTSFYTS